MAFDGQVMEELAEEFQRRVGEKDKITIQTCASLQTEMSGCSWKWEGTKERRGAVQRIRRHPREVLAAEELAASIRSSQWVLGKVGEVGWTGVWRRWRGGGMEQ